MKVLYDAPLEDKDLRYDTYSHGTGMDGNLAITHLPTGIRVEGVKEAGVKEAGVKEAGVKEAGVKEAGVKEAGVSHDKLRSNLLKKLEAEVHKYLQEYLQARLRT